MTRLCESTEADHAEGTIGNADVNADVLRTIQRMLNISSLRVLCDHRESLDVFILLIAIEKIVGSCMTTKVSRS